jgi:hypothetical protein
MYIVEFEAQNMMSYPSIAKQSWSMDAIIKIVGTVVPGGNIRLTYDTYIVSINVDISY